MFLYKLVQLLQKHVTTVTPKGLLFVNIGHQVAFHLCIFAVFIIMLHEYNNGRHTIKYTSNKKNKAKNVTQIKF